MGGKKFSEDYQPGPNSRRGKRGPDKRTLAINALKKIGRSEEEFFECLARECFDVIDPEAEPEERDEDGELIRDAVSSEEVKARKFIKGYHNELIKEFFGRLAPTDKATMPTFEIDGFLEAKTPVDKLDCILGAVSTGSLPVDIGSTLVSMVKDRQDICLLYTSDAADE